jgi:hypothetical protein
MKSLEKLAKVNDSITIYRYDNGWMIEIGGRDKDDEWVTSKILCNTEQDMFDLIKKYNTLKMDR